MEDYSEFFKCSNKWKTREFEDITEESNECRNQSYAFLDTGNWGEKFASKLFPKSIGSASKGGCAFDNQEIDVNTKEQICAREVKFCCLDGSKKCRECDRKVPRFQEKCLFCDKSDFIMKSDSRFSISAKQHMKYREKIKEYIIFVSKYNNVKKTINLKCYSINSTNNYFNNLVEKQYECGGNNCNILPFSYDFYMSGPCELFNIDFSENDDAQISNFNMENITPCNIPMINQNTGQPIFTKKMFTKLTSDKVGFSDFVENGGFLPYEQYGHLFIIKKKSYGKPRGELIRS